MQKLRVLAGTAFFGALFPAGVFAQDSAYPDEEVSKPIIIAEPIPQVAKTITVIGDVKGTEYQGQSVGIISSDEIDRAQSDTVSALLERLPGVTQSRNGPVGGFGGVRVRGAEAEQLVVLIDGVRVNDPASPAGGYDFGNLLSAGVGRLELLRGANSLIWGSDAIGGVLAVETRSDYDTKAVRAEYGSFDTKSLTGRITSGLGTSDFDLDLAGGWYDTDGFSSFVGGDEADGFRQYFLTGKAQYGRGGFKLRANGRFSESRAEIDGFAPPTFAFGDTAEFQKTRQWSTGINAEYLWDGFKGSAGYNFSQTRRDNFNPDSGTAATFSSKGESENIYARGDVYLKDDFSILVGAENTRSRYATGPFGNSGKTYSNGAFALLDYWDNRAGWPVGGFSIGGRVDDHKQFGTHVTFGANGKYWLTHGLRIFGSYGGGFKAPTLFQLLSDFGNAKLQPESSHSFDIGIQLGDRNFLYDADGFAASVTLFHRDTKNLIDFVSCFGVADPICAGRPFGTYDNVGRARAQGIELELGASLGYRFQANASYSYIKARNRTSGAANNGNALARRPEHALSLSVDWWQRESFEGFNIGADLRIVGDSFDNAANTRRLDSYALVTLRGAYPIAEAIEIYGRVENLFDTQYQTVADYGTAGRVGYVGVRARF